MLQPLINQIQAHLDAWLGILAACIPILGIPIFAFGSYIYKKLVTESKRRQLKKARAMLKQKQHTFAECLRRYLEYLLTDPRLTKIQTAGMTAPLELLDIYVQLRVHPESSLLYALDPVLRDAEETLEPDKLLVATQKSLEHRAHEALDPSEALRIYKHCVIVGDPGSGKTTILRYLTIKAARKELEGISCLPIYIQVNTFNQAIHSTLFDLLLEQLGEFKQLPEAHQQLQEMMKAGQILLLIDGLDETRVGAKVDQSEDSYGWMINSIKNLAASYINTPIIVTVRKAGYQHRPKLQGFHELEIVNFQPEDSRTFIIKWFNASHASNKEEKIRDLHAHLEHSLRMRALASNPLLLSLIVIVYEGHLHLPERRADLYKQCIEVLQTKWDASRDIARRHEFPLIYQSPLLQEVAWHFHNQNKVYFPTEELLEVIGKFLPTVDIPMKKSLQVLEQIAIENGLLCEQAQGWYGFSHLTFQEYFVTQYLINNQNLNVLLEHLHQPWWEEVLLLYVGSVNDASSLLHILLGHDEQFDLLDDMFSTNLVLAGRCLGEKPRISQQALRNEITSRLLDTLKQTQYSLLRERIANTLAMLDVTRVNNHLLQMLAGPDTIDLAIRESVGRALGLSGERSLSHGLIQLLVQPQLNRYIRIIITRTLSELRDTNTITDLLVLLENPHEDPFVRQSVATTLGLIGNAEILPRLRSLCHNKREQSLVLKSIVIAIGNIGSLQSIPTLHTILLDDHLDWHVRGSVAKVLGNFGQKETVEPLFRILENKDADPYVRRCVALALGNFPYILIPLERLYTLLINQEIDASIRGSIASSFTTLSKQAGQLTKPLELLEDEQMHRLIRMNIATALGVSGQSTAQINAVLIKIHQNQSCNYDLWACVVAAQGMLSIPTVNDDLLTLIADPLLPQDILPHIVQAMIRLGQRNHFEKQEIANSLIELLEDQTLDRYRGQCIVKVLCGLRELSIVPDLLIILQDQKIDRYIRQNVADAIAQLAQDEKSIEHLTNLLQTTDIVDDIYRTVWIVSRHVKRIQHS